MTINKSLISIAAATILAASFVGCSSDSDTYIPQDNTGGTTTAAIQPSVQAVDGYIYNATAKAHYLSEDNATMKTVTLTATPTTKDVVSGLVTLGSSTYALPTDTNSSVKSRIKFFSFATTSSSTAGTTYTPAAYIEADGVNGYDVNDTQLGTTVILAPGNSPIASPITSMIVSNNSGLFGTYAGAVPTSLVDLNATTFANIESNATAIATKLGLSDVNLLTADPIALGTTNPTYKLVTALLKDATSTDAATILAATTPTDLAGILTIISGTGAAGATLAGTLATSATNGAFSTADIAGMNIEKSVTAGTIQSLTPPSKTGKFALDGIEINSVDASTLAASGAKIANTAMLVDFNMTNTDGNISNTAFKLVLAMSGSKDFVSQNDSNDSGAIVVEVPFELNSTKTTANALAVPSIASTLVKWEAKASDGSQVITKSDVNATDLGIQSIFDTTTVANVLRVDAKTLINKIVTRADANLTGVTGLTTTGNFSEISNLQIALVDANGKIVGVTADGANSNPIAKTSFTSMTGGIAVSEGIKVINLGTTDLRGGTTAPNAKPSVTITAINPDMNASDTNASLAANVARSVLNKIVTVTKGAGTSQLDLNVTGVDEGSETNSTILISNLPAWITYASGTGTKVLASNNGVADYNLTVDGNYSLTTETTVVSNVKITDEFGKASTASDANVTFFFNLPPVATTKTPVVDENITVKYVGAVSNAQGMALDVNKTISGCFVTGHNTNISAVGCKGTTTDSNLTIDLNDTTKTGWWLTFNLYDNYGAKSVEYNATATGITAK